MIKIETVAGKLNIITTNEIKEELMDHDWTHGMSDDYDKVTAGQAAEANLVEKYGEEIITKISKAVFDGNINWDAEEKKMNQKLELKKGVVLDRTEITNWLEDVDIPGGLSAQMKQDIIIELFDGINPKFANVKGVGEKKAQALRMALSQFLHDNKKKEVKVEEKSLIVRAATHLGMSKAQVEWLDKAAKAQILQVQWAEGKLWYRFDPEWFKANRSAAYRVINGFKKAARNNNLRYGWSGPKDSIRGNFVQF